MAEQAEKANTTEAKEANGGGQTNGGGRKAVRAAAIAAATGATAIAAKKAFSGRSDTDEGDSSDQAKRRSGGSGGDSMFTEMLSSGWSAAKDSLLPFSEEAAGAAGEWVARNGPELVSDTLVPRFIRGFERAQKSSSGSDDQ
jgi:hypothetical protein